MAGNVSSPRVSALIMINAVMARSRRDRRRAVPARQARQFLSVVASARKRSKRGVQEANCSAEYCSNPPAYATNQFILNVRQREQFLAWCRLAGAHCSKEGHPDLQIFARTSCGGGQRSAGYGSFETLAPSSNILFDLKRPRSVRPPAAS